MRNYFPKVFAVREVRTKYLPFHKKTAGFLKFLKKAFAMILSLNMLP